MRSAVTRGKLVPLEVFVTLSFNFFVFSFQTLGWWWWGEMMVSLLLRRWLPFPSEALFDSSVSALDAVACAYNQGNNDKRFHATEDMKISLT